MNRPIVVVGSINFDLVCTAQRIPSPGETVRGDRFQTFHGGKGANQAVAAARLGGDVRMIGRVGDDDFGRDLRRGLCEAQVNVDGVMTAPGTPTGVALISVDAHGANSILVVPGANARLTPADLERSLPHLRSAGILLTQLEIPMETVEFLCMVARRAGVPLMLDPAPALALPAHVLRGVTYLTPNETEAATLRGLPGQEFTAEQTREAAEALLASGPANIILKLGGRGAYLAGAGGLRIPFPAIAVPVVDSTAAGDAFNGGVASALMRGLSLEHAVPFAMAVAALAVTRSGAQAAMPSRREVEAFLARGTLPDVPPVSPDLPNFTH